MLGINDQNRRLRAYRLSLIITTISAISAIALITYDILYVKNAPNPNYLYRQYPECFIPGGGDFGEIPNCLIFEPNCTSLICETQSKLINTMLGSSFAISTGSALSFVTGVLAWKYALRLKRQANANNPDPFAQPQNLAVAVHNNVASAVSNDFPYQSYLQPLIAS